MPPLVEIALIARRELRRNLRSAKGLLLLALSASGGGLTALALHKLHAAGADTLGPEQLEQLAQEAATRSYNEEIGRSLSHAPITLLFLLPISIWLAPLLVSLVGFDTLSSDLQFRTIRYWTVRARRESIFIGKVAGLWAAISLCTLATQAVAWGVLLGKGESSAVEMLTWGAKLWAMTLPMGLVWCAIAVLVSGQFRSPMLSMLTLQVVFIAIWAVHLFAKMRDYEWMTRLYPNNFDSLILSPDLATAALGVFGCLVYAAIVTATGALLFAKRDV